MMTMPKCFDCGKFCCPVEWKMIYSGVMLEPQNEIYKCASCVEKSGSFGPQPGIKPECSCGILTPNKEHNRQTVRVRHNNDPLRESASAYAHDG